MGNTVIQWFSKFQAGLVLYESFEADNWILNEGWGILNGTPVNSGDQAHLGQKSFKLDSSFPLITRDVSSLLLGTFYRRVWFYDDTSQTTSSNALATVNLTSSNVISVGVSNPDDTGHYVVIVNGTATVTSEARATGWQLFEFLYTGSSLTVYINGHLVKTEAIGGKLLVSVNLGTTDTTGADPFGYFDQEQLGRDSKIIVQIPVMQLFDFVISLWAPDDNGSEIDSDSGSDATSGDTLYIQLLNILTIDCPLTGELRFTKNSGLLLAISPIQDFFFGDSLSYEEIDFGRRVSGFNKPRSVSMTQKESTSGKNETIFFNARDVVSMTIPDLTDAQRSQLSRFWSWAQKGNIFSVAIDRDQLAYTLIETPQSGPAQDQLTIAFSQNFPVTGKVLVYSTQNEYYEEKVIDSYAGADQVVFTEFLVNQYKKGDALRACNFWPFCITTDRQLPISLSNPRANRWTFSPSFKEAL